MKLVYKLTAGYFVATCAILAVNGANRVRREVALFESHAIRDDRSIGRALRSSVLAVWRSEGQAPALALVDDANQSHGRLRFKWVWLDAAPKVHVPLDRLMDVTTDATTVNDVDDRGEPTRFTYVPATPPGGRRAVLELAESLNEQREYVKKTIAEAVLTTLSLVVAFGIVAMALGFWLVGRPVRALVDKARRMGEGDFGHPLPVRGGDELTVLASEINATCERLVTARDRIDAEAKARIAALEQLRHADRLSTVGKLASGIAHELGTPLNVISGRADMIATREVEGDAVLDSAKVIAQASHRVAGIIRQLLDFARRRGPQRAEHDLRTVTQQTTSLLRTMAEKKKVTVTIEDGVPVPVEVDSGQIQQALTNLVVNALQAVERGGHVVVTCGRDERGAFVRVKDDGPGIAPETLPLVFDPFFTTKDVGEGTGLGLSVAHGIVHDHGGTLEVESKPGEGAAFTIHLPLREPKAPEAQPQMAHP